MEAKYISRSQLPEWLRALAGRFEVLTPQRQGASVVFRPVDPAAPPRQPELNTRASESAKKAIFPSSEALFNFRKNLAEGQAALELREAPVPRPCLVFGLPACDARGFAVFDPVFRGNGPLGEDGGKFQDPYFIRRREQAVLIVKTCNHPLSTCFCNSVGGGPASPEGADVLATELKDGFVFEVISGKGSMVMDSMLLRPASEAQREEARQLRAAALANMPAPLDFSGCAQALRQVFDNAEFWRDQAAPCLSCGACTYLCPTCYCFDISDETQGNRGVRLRSWDSCMLPLYSLETSGHNPRPEKAQRLRNRVGHKFSYYPSLHRDEKSPGGRLACSGCGHCIKSCPSGLDIRSIVAQAIDKARSMAQAELDSNPAEMGEKITC